MKKNVRSSYSFRSQVMHAIIAVMVLGLLIVGYFLNKLSGSWQNQAYMLHKSFGILVFCLMFLRLFFVFKDGRPKLAATIPAWERVLARTVQFSLYFVLLAMPLSGWIMSVADGYIPSFFNWFNLDLPFIPLDKAVGHQFSNYHYFLAWVIFVLVVLHLLGNLKHYFWTKDKLISTMWNFKR